MDELASRVDEGFADVICAQPGFVSYEFVDCGDGEVMTISIFRGAGGAAGSRDLARRWSSENLQDLEFTRRGPLDGEILVSRARQEMLEPGHVGLASKFASARRYTFRDGSIAALMHKVDETLADRIGGLDGFEAYHALDCGRGEILSISLFRDQASAEVSDDLALQFVGEQLGEFDIERTEVFGGEVIVSRAVAELLEPAHA
jgi:hypothetical protein